MHFATLAIVTIITVGVGAIVALILYIAGRVLDALDVEIVSLIGFWVLMALVAGAVIFCWNIYVRTWHAILVGSSPDLRWVLRPERWPQVIAAALLLLPLVAVPLAGGFALVGFYYAVGAGLTPSAAFSEMISRCTSSAKAFWHTVAVGFLVTLYATALAVMVNIMGLMNSGLALTVTDDTFYSTTEVDWPSAVLGFGTVLVIAVALGFCLFHLSGLWTVGWARRLAGRPVGAPDDQNHRSKV